MSENILENAKRGEAVFLLKPVRLKHFLSHSKNNLNDKTLKNPAMPK